MSPQPAIPAVTYARVSSKKQVEEGHGLDSQESRCREYAERCGYDVVKTFRDEGVSGKLIERPGTSELLDFLAKQDTQHVVIIDDISRLARGIISHSHLRAAIEASGGKLESPSIEFGSDPDSQLVENLLASVAQHQRQKNAEQVVNRMRARFLAGYWVSNPPVGYKFQDVEGHGKMIVPMEPNAQIIKTVLEGFACGHFASKAEIKRYLEAQPSFPKAPRGDVQFGRVETILTSPLYAGYMNAPKWGISLHPAQHEPLISFETWQRNQDRLNGKCVAPTRKDTRADFPLRGIVSCASCEKPMTACWSKGRNRMYGYYFCQTRGCENRRINIRKEDIEGDFEALLRQMRPTPGLFHIATQMLREIWEDRQAGLRVSGKTLKSELAKLEAETTRITQRLVKASKDSVIAAYEAEIDRLHLRKTELVERSRTKRDDAPSFERAYRTGLSFLGNPWKLWSSDRLSDRRLLLRLAFANHIPYCREAGYRTAIPTLPFKVLGGFCDTESGMVGPEGLEPPTKRL